MTVPLPPDPAAVRRAVAEFRAGQPNSAVAETDALRWQRYLGANALLDMYRQLEEWSMPKRQTQHPAEPPPCPSTGPEGQPCGRAAGHDGQHAGYGKVWD